MSKQNFKILSLDGGGYKGLFTITLLDEFEKKFKCKCYDIFDLFAGTSTGSIIALGLAIGKTAEEIKSMYLSIGPKIFKKKNFLSPVIRAKYNNTLLNAELRKFYDNKKIGDVKKNKKLIVIPATNLTNKNTRIFKTDYIDGLNQHDDYSLADIATASSAAPTYFKSYSINRPTDETLTETFADGGLFANNPSSCALIEAIKYSNVSLENIKLLSIGTSNSDKGCFLFKTKSGLIDWNVDLIKTPLEMTSLIHSCLTSFIFESIGDDVEHYLRIEPSTAINNLELDDVSQKAIDYLKNDAITIANQYSNMKFIKSIFCMKKEEIITQ